MIISWGGYSFENGECAMVGYQIKPMRDERTHAKYAKIVTATFAGEFIFTGEVDQDDISERIEEAKAAFDLDYQDLVVAQNDSTPTPYSMSNSDSENMSGNLVLYSHWPSQEPEDYANSKYFEFAIQAVFINPDINLINYEQHLTIQGTAGPIRQWERLINGVWENKIIHDSSTKKIVQTGQASGFGNWPIPATPLLDPLYEHEELRVIKRVGPSFYYRKPEIYTIQWAYHFETPLEYTPTRPVYPPMR